MALDSLIKRLFISPEIQKKLERINAPTGSMGYDPWGLKLSSNRLATALFGHFYQHYFRVQTHGLDNVPGRGPVLIVPNHSGQLPIDGMLIAYALATRKNQPRIPRAMIERFFPTVPYLGNWLNAIGGVLGDPVNCGKLLQRSEAIIVFPEGVRGSGKLYRDRYQLKRFGNGFMHLAMQNQATIIPTAVIGCEETIPAIANIRPLARLLGLPYVPVAAPIILPARVHLHFGAPLHFDNEDLAEADITQRVERVKDEIRRLLDAGLAARRGIFL